MELRTLRPGERDALLELLDGWEMRPPWTGRAGAFFRRYVEDDPAFREADVHVAAAPGERVPSGRRVSVSSPRPARLLACVQVFPRRVRVAGGSELALGGIGSVFTRPEARGRGLAGALLARAEADLRARGVALGMLFAGPVDFYARRGWLPWPFARALYLREGGEAGQGGEGREAGEGGRDPARTRAAAGKRGTDATSRTHPAIHRAIHPAMHSAIRAAILPFERRRDLPAVRRLHAAYSAERPATLVRDTSRWRSSLAVAGNPDEDFRVARRGEAVTAYARLIHLEGHPILAEFGRAASREAAADLAALLDATLERGAFGPAPADPALETELALRRFRVRPLPDPSSMLRCLDARALAKAAGAEAGTEPGAQASPAAEAEARAETSPGASAEAALLQRLLPPERCLFWPADRF